MAAHDYDLTARTWLAARGGKAGANIADLSDLLARAHDKGYEACQADVVAWLRSRGDDVFSDVVWARIAAAIERGDHVGASHGKKGPCSFK